MTDEPSGLTTICRRTTHGVTISICGVLDAAQMHAVERYLGPEFDGFGGDVVLDLHKVQAIAAEALDFLAAGRRRLAVQGRRLVIASASPAVERALAVRRSAAPSPRVPDGRLVAAAP